MTGNLPSDQDGATDEDGLPVLATPSPEDEADDTRLEGRLVEPGSEDVDSVDEEKDAVGSLVADDDAAQSAEEAAMHITDNP